jgi:transcriptional regulator with XRE-family HTH domain
LTVLLTKPIVGQVKQQFQLQIDIGNRIATKRGKIGLSFLNLAKKAGVSKGTLSCVERGLRAPNILTLIRIANALGTTVQRLIS